MTTPTKRPPSITDPLWDDLHHRPETGPGAARKAGPRGRDDVVPMRANSLDVSKAVTRMLSSFQDLSGHAEDAAKRASANRPGAPIRIDLQLSARPALGTGLGGVGNPFLALVPASARVQHVAAPVISPGAAAAAAAPAPPPPPARSPEQLRALRDHWLPRSSPVKVEKQSPIGGLSMSDAREARGDARIIAGAIDAISDGVAWIARTSYRELVVYEVRAFNDLAASVCRLHPAAEQFGRQVKGEIVDRTNRAMKATKDAIAATGIWNVVHDGFAWYERKAEKGARNLSAQLGISYGEAREFVHDTTTIGVPLATAGGSVALKRGVTGLLKRFPRREPSPKPKISSELPPVAGASAPIAAVIPLKTAQRTLQTRIVDVFMELDGKTAFATVSYIENKGHSANLLPDVLGRIRNIALNADANRALVEAYFQNERLFHIVQRRYGCIDPSRFKPYWDMGVYHTIFEIPLSGIPKTPISHMQLRALSSRRGLIMSEKTSYSFFLRSPPGERGTAFVRVKTLYNSKFGEGGGLKFLDEIREKARSAGAGNLILEADSRLKSFKLDQDSFMRCMKVLEERCRFKKLPSDNAAVFRFEIPI